MSIRIKIFATIIVAVATLTAAAYAISSRTLLQSYLIIEREATQKDLTRAQNAIDNSLTQLTIKLRDWAQWDDSYDFAANQNQEFIDSNLQEAGLINLEINLLMYARLDGSVIYRRFLMLEEGIFREDEFVSTAITAANKFGALDEPGTSVAGIISLPDGPFLITALPVVTTLGEGPVQGVIMFGRYFDEEKVAELEALTQLSVDIFPYDATDLPADVEAAKVELLDHAAHIEPLSEERIAAYSVIYDWDGKPASIMRVDRERPVYAQGKRTVGIFLTFSVLALLAFGIMVALLFEKIITGRLARLSSDVGEIGVSHDLSRHVRSQGTDEIGKVAGAVNAMIDELEKSRAEEAKLP
jgi:sensor domain CHASE-containing protein